MVCDLESMDPRSWRTSKELELMLMPTVLVWVSCYSCGNNSLLSCVPLLPAGSVAPLHRSQVPVQHLPHHLLRGERRRVEEALQALRCSEALPPCKAAAFTRCVHDFTRMADIFTGHEPSPGTRVCNLSQSAFPFY